MPQAKYKPFCGKLAYKTEQNAWEHVIYWKRRGYLFQEPYLCPKCGNWHLTRKHFQGKVPTWVWDYSHRTPKKEKIKHKDETLPLNKQKEIYKILNNQPSGIYRKVRFWLYKKIKALQDKSI